MTQIRFKFLTGDCNWQEYGGKFISKRFNNGDFDYWQVIDVCNIEGNSDKNANTYYVSLSVYAPSQVPEEEIESAFKCVDFESWGDINNPLHVVDALSSYGNGATVWIEEGTNIRKLMKEARKEASLCNTLFGFYLDRPQNQIGSTGWDMLEGNILAGLYK